MSKKLYINIIALILTSCVSNSRVEPELITPNLRETSRALQAVALADTTAFERLAELCDTFGHRLSGSQSLEDAIDWILTEMEADGFDNAHGESVMVPHWVRGNEELHMLEPWEENLAILGLGGSIGTPEEGITAEVIAVSDFEELARRKDEVLGKIVVYNAPFTSYGKTVTYRYRGAIEAAKYGAVASLIRSVTPKSLNTPHTGGMTYADTVKKIPQAAITVEAAEMLHRMTKRGQAPKLHLKMEGQTLPDTESRNIVLEIRGSEKPDEIIVMGGHTDSWDVGQGAMDDASGCVASWEALRLIKTLGLKPKRTIRVVFWTNEENGLRGGKAYAEDHKDENHILAIETDGGVFAPEGFGFTGPDDMREKLQQIASLLEPLGAGKIFDSGGGADISPLTNAGVPGMGLRVDGSTYFWYHHTAADMMTMLDRDEFNKCVAALAIMAYSVSEME
ncbi:MAG: M20/M25/M40 family metallo-hydrolase [Candidatus Marinimicrobia bacterium]|nr:M20/M25/M40 family metallo-hydrolase [Candidatus Neomarinimicrobiota bacterium]